jgi:hypothetical protein
MYLLIGKWDKNSTLADRFRPQNIEDLLCLTTQTLLWLQKTEAEAGVEFGEFRNLE